MDQRVWTAADLSAFCHCFRPDGGVCKAAGEACQARESSKGEGILGNPGGSQLFSILKGMDTVGRGEIELWKYQIRRRERCEARKERKVSQQAFDGKCQAEVQRQHTQTHGTIRNS